MPEIVPTNTNQTFDSNLLRKTTSHNYEDLELKSKTKQFKK